jgi:Flp pilus assembly protein CpaB
MRNKRLIVAALLLAALVVPGLLFAGPGQAEKKGKGIKILFIPFTMEHVFQKELCDGAKIPIPGYDVQVFVEDPYGKIEKEL